MTFYLRDTDLLFKVSLSTKALDMDSFKRLFESLKDFPLKDEYPEIKGIYLSGDRFFQNILLTETLEISSESIEKIRRITPIIETIPYPFIYEADTLEIRLPFNNGHELETNNKLVEEINDYLESLGIKFISKKIEVSLTGEVGSKLLDSLYRSVIPGLERGKYKYELKKGNVNDSGEITLPVKYLTLPQSLQPLIFDVKSRYTLKLLKNGNRFIIQRLKENEIRLLLYSDEIKWLMDTLLICHNNNMFEKPVSDEVIDIHLPHF